MRSGWESSSFWTIMQTSRPSVSGSMGGDNSTSCTSPQSRDRGRHYCGWIALVRILEQCSAGRTHDRGARRPLCGMLQMRTPRSAGLENGDWHPGCSPSQRATEPNLAKRRTLKRDYPSERRGGHKLWRYAHS